MAKVVCHAPIGAWTEVCGACYRQVQYAPGDITSYYDYGACTHYRFVVCPGCDTRRHFPKCDKYNYSDYGDYGAGGAIAA